MQKPHFLSFKKIVLPVIILLLAQMGLAQSVYVPYSYQLYQKFNTDVYAPDSSFHTALKPYLLTNGIVNKYNAVMNNGVDSSRTNFFLRKIFNEHLVEVQKDDYTFYFDYLTDQQGGRDFPNKTTTFINTRGYEFGGTVGSKFFFYSSGFENQAKFVNYLHNYVDKIDFIPGEAYDRTSHAKNGTADWSYVTAMVSYSPIKQLNFTLGEDKNFIGDGYRSLLLSDYAANYPFLRATATIGKVQYMWMVANLEDALLPSYDNFGNNRRKWAAFHYFDWTVTNRFSLGFFNAVIAADANDQGTVTHGFDINYINPVLFVSSLGPKTPYPDKVLAGFTSKYKIFDKTTVYAQLLIDRFKASNFFSGNNADNTNGFQLGIRGSDLFKVKSFNYLFEYNTVKPYTYAAQQSISSYTDYSQPLTDPLGANFKEMIGILNYSIGRFDLQGQLNYASYGLDATGDNNGKDVNLPFNPATVASVNTGQGIRTHLYYGAGTVSFLINPKYNLHLELTAIHRQEKNDLGTKTANYISVGVRSSFRQVYKDF